MSNFAFVENGEIKGRYDALPVSWENVSGLNLLTDENQLNLFGWYTIQHPQVAYDETTQYISDRSWTFENNVVTEHVVIADKQPEDLSQLRENLMVFVRQERNRLLAACDWTTLSDVQASKSDEWKKGWSDYRMVLRDMPEILNKYQPDALRPDQVVWPPIPTV